MKDGLFINSSIDTFVEQNAKKQQIVRLREYYDAIFNRKSSYVSAFRVENFKAFEDSGWIELKQITLLYGENSSGKSSLYKVLEILKICYEKMMRGENFRDTAELSEILGTFDDMRNVRTGEKQIIFRFRITDDDCNKSVFYEIYLTEDEFSPYGVVEKAQIVSNEMQVSLLQNYDSVNIFFLSHKAKKPIEFDMEQLESEVMAVLRNFAQTLSIISAQRVQPQREMVFGGNTKMKWNEANVYQMLFTMTQLQGQSLEIVEQWLAKFGYEYYWKMIGQNKGSFMLRDLQTGLETNLVDNGFGISQSLPLAVGLADSESKSMLIDSPEAFLQTKMQSELGDLLIEGTKGKKSLVETGSEYLLIRLQRRIAEKKFDANNLAIYFIDEQNGRTECKKIDVNELGDLENAPEEFLEFFSENYLDILERDKAKRESLLKEKQS